MHSRIFLIEKKSSYVGHDSIYIESELQEFCPGLFDYVDHLDDRCDLKHNYQWLSNCLKGSDNYPVLTNEEENTLRFLEGYKTEYFKEKYIAFKKIVNGDNFEAIFSGEQNSFNDIGESCDLLYSLKRMISDESEFWVIDPEGCNLRTMDDFIRSIEYNVDYQVYDVFDYHI